MKILPQLQTTNKTNFTSNHREVRNLFGSVTNRNTTMIFRQDFSWINFTDYLINKYKDVKKPNIYCYASSDGAEPYSLAMILISKLGEKGAKKFFPIIAKDKDAFILKDAKKGIINLTEYDLGEIKVMTGRPVSNFFDTVDEFNDIHGDWVCKAKAKGLLKDAVVFEQADVVKDIKNIKKDNSIVLIRHVWPYLGKNERTQLIENLDETLGVNSAFIFSRWDNKKCNIEESLINKNFQKSPIDFCYEKVITEPENKKQLSNPDFWVMNFIRRK